MGQDQDPYPDAGGFTPYQPDATPEGEPAESSPPPPPPPPPSVYPPGQQAPFVPYGNAPEVPHVPYGGTVGDSITPFVVTAASVGSGRWVSWLIGIVIAFISCGGALVGIVFGILGNDDEPTTSTPDIDVPTFSIDIPTFSVDIPTVDIPSIPTPVFANDLERGQCINGTGFEPGSQTGIANLEVAACGGAHNAQVLEVRVLSQREAGDYDFADADQGNTSCFPLFSPAQKELFRGDKYTLLSFTETAEPAAGDKVACLVVRTDGERIRGFLPKR